MSDVSSLVERAAKYGQPALALTDHGVLSGSIQLYKSCKKLGIVPFPGIETYIIDPKFDLSALQSDELKEAQRYHLTIMALSLRGYQGLVRLSTKAFTRPRFHKFPRLLVDDLVEFGRDYGNDVAISTGCYFGLVQRKFWEEGIDATEGVIRQLQSIFPHLYVELHNHDIPDGFNQMGETELTSMLLGVSQKFSLPLLSGPDNHYLDQSQKSAHILMKKMVYAGQEDGFPGDTYHLPSAGWMEEKFDPEVWSSIEQSCEELLSLNTLAIPQLDKFEVHVPRVSTTPDLELRELVYKALSNIGLDKDTNYIERCVHELNVIKTTKTANYFLLVNQIVEYIKDKRIPIEARGSAGGSLVCFLLGITQTDPLIWGLTFERFMSEDRIEPPDIDIDIADRYRYVVLEYLNNLEINGTKYKTSQIGTYGRLGQNEDDINDTGSAFNTYVSYIKRKWLEQAWADEKEKAERENRKPVKARADEKGSILFNMSDDAKIKKLEDVKKYHPEDYSGLKQIIAMNSVYKSRGTHAGGILISSQETAIEDFVPLMMASDKDTSKDTVVTQYTMNDLKYLGLLKMDWLGQTSLSVMSKCMEFLDRDPLDFTWIPFEDEQVLKYVHSRGSHIGLFHLEQYPKSVAMSELKPQSTMDFVIWQAYSMPGAVDSGAKDIYLKRRKAKKFKYDYDHPVLHNVFDVTLGVMLFQEQVLDTCRGIGMDGTELTNFFSIVKDSGSGAVERNRKRLEAEKPRFAELAAKAGFTQHEIEWVWNQIVAMGGYAFNKAHAAAYGIRSYRTAYLKYYHPTEYMAALLYCWAGKNTLHNKRQKIKKDEAYLREAKKMNLRILPVRVNKSMANWSVDKDRKALRKGYLSIKGIGPAVAPRIEENMPYRSLEDFCERSRVSGGKPYLEALRKGKPVESYTGVLKTLVDLECLELL